MKRKPIITLTICPFCKTSIKIHRPDFGECLNCSYRHNGQAHLWEYPINSKTIRSVHYSYYPKLGTITPYTMAAEWKPPMVCSETNKMNERLDPVDCTSLEEFVSLCKTNRLYKLLAFL